ncbi:unnamed protein product [Rangifer tarandus platyrhynchus]|uniref:Uncharacterized protein n=1 Tax=Rangifer tarandus platyrhynchus TaxID=3082113 RepID=A0AC59YWF1_RANTA
MGTRACSVALAVALSVWAGQDVKDAKHLLSPLLTLVFMAPGAMDPGPGPLTMSTRCRPLDQRVQLAPSSASHHPPSGFNRSPNSSAAHVTGPCLRRGS